MTSANPPSPYFNGITYNSQFFKTSTSSSASGLTQSQANALYMKKPLDPVANDSTTMNTTIKTLLPKTVTLTQLGETYNYILSATSINATVNGGTVPICTLTIANAGIYMISYQVYFGTNFGCGNLVSVQTYLNASAPIGNTSIANVINCFPSPYLNAFLSNPVLSTSWTGLINANATVVLTAIVNYNATAYTAYIYGNDSASGTYLTITRIA